MAKQPTKLEIENRELKENIKILEDENRTLKSSKTVQILTIVVPSVVTLILGLFTFIGTQNNKKGDENSSYITLLKQDDSAKTVENNQLKKYIFDHLLIKDNNDSSNKTKKDR